MSFKWELLSEWNEGCTELHKEGIEGLEDYNGESYDKERIQMYQWARVVLTGIYGDRGKAYAHNTFCISDAVSVITYM